MPISRFRLIVCLAVVCGLAGAALPQQPAAVAKMLALFARLQSAQQQQVSGQPPQHVSFDLTESELNEYMRYSLRATPRPGVQDVTVKVFPYNYISTYTVVDFDAIEKWKPGTIPTLLRPVLTGRKAIWVDYRFQANAGTATFSVEKAYFGNLRIPAFAVEKMIQVVAARQPEHYDTSKPVRLPFGLRQMATRGQVIHGEN